MSTMLYLLVSVIAFAITAALGKWMIPFLHKLKFGQTIREVGPSWHKNKQGTPTMGGLMFILGIGVATVALGWQHMLAGGFVPPFLFLFPPVFGALGFLHAL